MPQQNSITSSPRVTSPSASESTLPCSAVSSFATSSRRSSHELADREEELGRFASDTARHARNASFAACTAWSTSSTVAKSSAPVWRPVAGLNTGPAAARLAGDAAAADPVADPRDALVLLDGRSCKLGHSTPPCRPAGYRAPVPFRDGLDPGSASPSSSSRPGTTGSRFELLREPITPLGLHYLLIHFDIPHVDGPAWRLLVAGRVERPLELRSRTPGTPGADAHRDAGVRRPRPCALLPRQPACQPWLSKAVARPMDGDAAHAAPEEAGLHSDALEVVFTASTRTSGGVEHTYERSLPVAEALRSDVLLAYAISGQPLPPQHGFRPPDRPRLVRDDTRQWLAEPSISPCPSTAGSRTRRITPRNGATTGNARHAEARASFSLRRDPRPLTRARFSKRGRSRSSGAPGGMEPDRAREVSIAAAEARPMPP